MKRFLPTLLAALALPTSVNENVDAEVHKKCLEARDYACCVNTNINLSHKKDKEITGINLDK
jgi:carboxyl-terminal processing protease